MVYLKQDGKKPVPNVGTESGPGRGCSQMLRTLLFPDINGKNPVPGKWHSGMQTSRSDYDGNNINRIIDLTDKIIGIIQLFL